MRWHVRLAYVAMVVCLPGFFGLHCRSVFGVGEKMSRCIHGIVIRSDVGISAARSCFRFLLNVMTIRFAAAATASVVGTWAQAGWAQEAQRVSITVPAITR